MNAGPERRVSFSWRLVFTSKILSALDTSKLNDCRMVLETIERIHSLKGCGTYCLIDYYWVRSWLFQLHRRLNFLWCESPPDISYFHCPVKVVKIWLFFWSCTPKSVSTLGRNSKGNASEWVRNLSSSTILFQISFCYSHEINYSWDPPRISR